MSWYNTQYLNSSNKWGWITIFIHWLTAMTVIALFVLGTWMVDLTYYDSWYRSAPHIHKSIGILLFLLTLFRIVWLCCKVKPAPLSHSETERYIAGLVHWLLYLVLLSLMLSGYLISTADGRAIELFNWFEIPALLSGIEGQADVAGKIHYALAISLLVLVSLHAMAALKHHFIDKDKTLSRMSGCS